MKSLNIGIIGAGLAGLSAAGFLSKMGHKVTILEKNEHLGGRVRTLKHKGFEFDTGAFTFSMISEIDRWFAQMGFDRADFYEVKKLKTRYKVFFDQTEVLSVPSDLWQVKNLFERYEQGGARKLDNFLKNSGFKYDYFLDRLAYKNYYGISDFLNDETTINLGRLNLIVPLNTFNGRYFKSDILNKILSFPIIFKGMDPDRAPAFFNFLNYSEFENGNFCVVDGAGKIGESMGKVLEKMGVKIKLGCEVKGLALENMEIKKVLVKTEKGDENMSFDVVINAADYAFFEQLLPSHYRNLDIKKVEKSGSWMTFCLALDKEIKELDAVNIFIRQKKWVKSGQNESQSFKSKGFLNIIKKKEVEEKNDILIVNKMNNVWDACEKGQTALTLHVPLKNSLKDSDELRAEVFNEVIDLLETRLVQNVRKHIIFRRSFFKDDLKADFNSFFADSFGFSMNFNQMFFRRPANKSAKVLNLYYAGQNTTPGGGAVLSLISGQVVADRIKEELGSKK